MLSDLKLMLGFTDVNEERDNRLQLIIDSVSARLKTLLGGLNEVPEELSYIVVEVSIIRFNKIGSEGMARHNVEGDDITFSDNDFSEFTNDINAYLEKTSSTAQKGGFKFL